MKGLNGIQMSLHPKFWELMKDIKDERVKLGKERAGKLSDKRLSLTIYKLLNSRKDLLELLINAEINLNEA